MHGYRGKKYAGGIKRKRRWKNTEYKHRIQRHDAHRHCTLPIKRRCARISNMEITKMKGGRIAKYRYRESMNEKAPEVAERSSKRKCLRMGRSSKKVARRPGAEMMWPSGGGSRTCNHKGSAWLELRHGRGCLGPDGCEVCEGRTAGVRLACTRKEMPACRGAGS